MANFCIDAGSELNKPVSANSRVISKRHLSGKYHSRTFQSLELSWLLHGGDLFLLLHFPACHRQRHGRELADSSMAKIYNTIISEAHRVLRISLSSISPGKKNSATMIGLLFK